MPTIVQSAMLASVLVGMISIPAASQNLDVSQPIVEDMDNISASVQNPENVEETFGPESYRKSVETAFDEFNTVLEGDSSSMTHTTPESEVSVESEPGERVFSLETPSGTIERTYSSESVVEQVSTSRGTLTTRRDQGTVEVEFRGQDRDSVEATASDLRKRLDSRVQRLRDRYNATRETATISQGDIEVEIKPEDGEYIRISSHEGVDLHNWTVSDEAGNTYEFGDFSLQEGESVTLYSGSGEDTGSELYWGQSQIWNNDGDTAYVFDSQGEKVAEKSY